MKINWSKLSRLRFFALPAVLIVFVCWGARVVPGWRYQMNPDGTGYISVAHKYLTGHFAEAVNAYWSPLFSWLLVPLIAAGIVPPLATKVLSVGIGAGLLAAAWWLMANLKLTRDVRFYVSLTLTPILLYFGMYVTTPDLLVTAAIVLYLAQLTSPKYLSRRPSGIVTGALGAIAYFAKAYALPFFLVHFTTVTIAQWWRSKGARRRVAWQAICSYAAFAIVVGAWSAALTNKYGYFTTGSTGQFNLAWNGPNFRLPIHEGFIAPPDAHAVSAWDDATYFDVVRWNPFGSPEERAHFAKNRERNWNAIVAISQSFTWLLWPIILAGVLLAGSGAEPTERQPGLAIVAALLLYPIGYYCLHVEQRFLMPVCVLLLIVGTFAVGRAASVFKLGPLRRAAAMAFLCVSFLSVATWTMGKDPWPAALSRWSLKNGWGAGREMQTMSDQLAGAMPPRAKIASVGNWGATLYLASYLDLAYFGEAKGGATSEQILAELRKLGVEYLFVWGDPAHLPFVKSWPEIAQGRVSGLHVYRIESAANAPATTRGSLVAASR